MCLKKIAAVFVLVVFAVSTLVGCGKGSVSTGTGQNTEKGTKEPELVSVNQSITWPGAELVVGLSYEKEVDQSQVKIMIGGLEAGIMSRNVYNNVQQFRLRVPAGLTAGTHAISATANGKECKSALSLNAAAPVITAVKAYTTSNSIGIETEHIEKNAAQIKVYANGAELPYSDLKDLMAAGKYAVMADVPAGTKSGEVTILYGANKSNTMTFTME